MVLLELVGISLQAGCRFFLFFARESRIIKVMEQKRSAGIIINDGAILLMHRVRDGKEFYAFPGGGIEQGEEPSETVVREVKEETGLDVVCGDLVYRTHGGLRSEQFFYVCEYQGGEAKLPIDSPENMRMKDGRQYYKPEWISLSQLEELIVYPVEIKDAVLSDAPVGFREAREFSL